MRQITINENDAGQRLDKFLTKLMPGIPQSMLYKSLRKSCVRVNGKHIKDGAYRLTAGDIMTLYFKDEFFPSTPKKIEKSDVRLNVVYEDDNILIVNKPAGLVCHADENGTRGTLIGAVKAYLYEHGEYDPAAERTFSPALCNRLDRNTEGLVIAAKNAAALRAVNEKIRERQIQKLYLCAADGIFDKKSDTLVSYITRDEKRSSVSDRPSENSKEIITRYTVLAESGNQSLVEVELLTGRTHQIRAQLSAIGHPLSGDKKYGSKTPGGYNLCAYRLVFDFPPNGCPLDYMAGTAVSVSSDFAKKFLSQKS